MPESDQLIAESGDVIELILDDHRRMEALLRDLRDSSQDRVSVRDAFSALHVAHAEAEEAEVYPVLRGEGAVSSGKAHHGKHEHAEAHRALLAVLRMEELEGEDFNERVEELSRLVDHHLTEEELTILNPAREDVEEGERRRLGEVFAMMRNASIRADCGRVEVVERLVEEAEADGLLEA